MFPLIALWALAPAAAGAAEKCGPLTLVNRVQMTRIVGTDVDLVPITINGVPKNFLFDTGGTLTQIQRPVAEDLKLPISHDGPQLFSLTGNVSRDQAKVSQFVLGRMHGSNTTFPISPIIEAGKTADGIFAPDYLEAYDADVDFGNDTLNLFSPDHCPGGVLYWKAATVAAIPLVRDDHAIIVTAMLDGRPIRAMLDTGSTDTALRMDIAQKGFGLTMGAKDTPESGTLNGDASLKTYRHMFQSLSFGGVAVSNPRIVIMPNAAGRNAERIPSGASRTRSEKDLVNAPELIIGMNVLRKLHVYMAFREKRLYISEASNAPAPMVVSTTMPPVTITQRAATEIAFLDTQIAAKPGDADLLNRRCFMRGLLGSKLDAALEDCDQALKLKPDNISFLDRRAMILYRQGKYRAALEAYNQVLAVDPDYAASLLMRGYARGKLGDPAGQKADIAAALAGQGNIQARFRDLGIIK